MGFTFIEMLIAMTVAAVIMGIALPRMAPAREGAAVRSAKQIVAAYMSSARQAAVRRGGTAAFNASGNEIWVTSTSNGTVTTVEPRLDLKEQHGVTLNSDVTTVQFNARGFANPRLATAKKLRLMRGERVDSICVTLLGMVGTCGL